MILFPAVLMNFPNSKVCLIGEWSIRLRARDLYEVIVDEGEARINYHFIENERESE